MTTQLQLRRGTTAQHAVFTGAQSEVTHNTTTKRLHIHDGAAAGGKPLALLEDLSPYALTANVHNVPVDGAAGQVLMKTTNASYAMEWAYPTRVNVSTNGNASIYTLNINDQYLRFSYSGTGKVIIPQNSAVPFPIGTQITIVWTGGTLMSVEAFSGVVTVLAPDGMNMRKVGSTATLTKVASDSWDFSGDVKIS